MDAFQTLLGLATRKTATWLRENEATGFNGISIKLNSEAKRCLSRMACTAQIALTALVFLLARVLHAEDWTTTDGKTYHNVRDVSHNNECRYIECDEGKVSVEVDALPPYLQKRFHCDPQAEAELDRYLKRLKIAATPPDVRAYAAQVRQLISNPTVLKSATPEVLKKIQQQRLTGGGYESFLLPQADANALCHDETILEGLILMALEAKVDPAIDTTKPMYINGNSEEQRGEREQWQIKRDIWECTVRGVRYLKVVYHHQDDGVSVDAEVRPILTGAGIDAASIDLLVGKTQAKDN